MPVFSTKQVRHLYIAKAVKDSIDSLTDPGDIFVNKTANNELFFNVKGALGALGATDRIKFEGIEGIKATSSDDLAHKVNGYKICLDPDLNGGEPVPGQDYYLTARIYEYKGMSGENEGEKYGIARARTGMSASDLYKAIAVNFAQNNDCEPIPFLKVTLLIGGEEVEVHGTDKVKDIDGDAEAIYVWEKHQGWIRGLKAQQFVSFLVTLRPILCDGEIADWGVVSKEVSDETFPEGELICDLEWFAMGERGDQYRGMGYPNVIPTKYLAEPDKLYDVINIHYNYRDNDVYPQASEKALQIACLNDGSHDVCNSIIEAINSVTGLEIATL